MPWLLVEKRDLSVKGLVFRVFRDEKDSRSRHQDGLDFQTTS